MDAAKKKFEPDDPFEMVGVVLPEAMDDATLTEMACCFVQELALMGYPAQRIMRLFSNPFYQGPYQVYRAKGEGFVRALVEQLPPGPMEAEPSHG